MKTPLDNDLNKVYESFNPNHNNLRQTLMASLPDRSKQHKRAGRINHVLAFIGGTIMRSRITKLAAAAVIIIAVLIGIKQLGGPIDGASVAWADIVKRVEQSHDEYMKELLSATEEKDTEKVNFYAHLLEEFWQKLGWLARAELEPEFKIQLLTMIADQKARYDERGQSAQTGIRLFLEHEDQFSDWLDKIEDTAWIN